MNPPLHPLFTHLPLALAVLLPAVAAALALALWRSWLPPRAWWLAIAGQALLVGSGWLALRTGEADEERVERVVAESALEHHEHAAQTFVAASAVVLALAFVPWLLRHRPRGAAIARAATAVGGLAVLALAWQVGKAGGDLVYRHGAANAFASAAAGSTGPALRNAGDDDDR